MGPSPHAARVPSLQHKRCYDKLHYKSPLSLKLLGVLFPTSFSATSQPACGFGKLHGLGFLVTFTSLFAKAVCLPVFRLYSFIRSAKRARISSDISPLLS